MPCFFRSGLQPLFSALLFNGILLNGHLQVLKRRVRGLMIQGPRHFASQREHGRSLRELEQNYRQTLSFERHYSMLYKRSVVLVPFALLLEQAAIG